MSSEDKGGGEIYVQQEYHHMLDTHLPQLDRSWARLLRNMDRLEVLNIGKLYLFPNPGVKDDFQTCHLRLRVLRFLGAETIDCEDLLTILAASPSLSELYVSDAVTINPAYAFPMEDLGIPPATEAVLQSLTIGAASGLGISTLLFYFSPRTPLRRLQLIIGQSISAHECTSLLRAAAPTVEELVLRMHSHLPLLSILQSPAPYQRLRRLHLKHAGLESYAYSHSESHWMIGALAHISQWEHRLILREIVLSMPMPPDKKLTSDEPVRDPSRTGFHFPWVQLDMAMSKLAQENPALVFEMNIRGPWKNRRAMSLTDPLLGRYRLRMSRTEELRPQVLTVFMSSRWSILGEFGGHLY